jgi:hypothetical protein
MAFTMSPVQSRSGPPSSAHKCRRRMPRRSVATCRAIAPKARRRMRREGGPRRLRNELRLGKPRSHHKCWRRMRSSCSGLLRTARSLLRILHAMAAGRDCRKCGWCDDYSSCLHVLRIPAVGIDVAFCHTWPKTREVSTFSGVATPGRASMSASRTMSIAASPTTTRDAAPTQRAPSLDHSCHDSLS